MSTAAHSHDTARPSIGGSLVFLLLSFPLGIASFVVLVTMTAVGTATAIVWVGLPIIAATVLVTRAAGHLERARVHALLGTFVPSPRRPLPEGSWRNRWRTRLTDSATWREYGYLFLLLPLGIAEFVIMVATWTVSLALLALPIYYRFLPDGVWHFPSYDEHLRWVTVDSVGSALPWSALGLLFAVATALLTRGLGTAHARLARLMLGPTAARERELDELGTVPVAPVAG
ncbi:sensor domain-containing protein [Saccharomonospora piscinae]|uniref:sensor domain-containing protein n=1 Tax=Saccharomonospora piscinae TaxID=687388 RepID=UPI000465F62E|nr:sensor domain-containing protein [Saccharomonospora piscinae]